MTERTKNTYDCNACMWGHECPDTEICEHFDPICELGNNTLFQGAEYEDFCEQWGIYCGEEDM